MAGKADIQAGRAFVELFVKGAKFEAGLKAMSKQLEDFGSAARDIGTKIGALGAAGIGTLGAAVAKFASSGSALQDMSMRTGMSVEALSQLQYAAEQSGASLDDVEKASKKMASVLYDAANGSESAEKTLTALGLSLADLQGMSPDEQFMSVATALSEVGDASTKAALAQDIFGRSGAMLLPMFSEGAKGLSAMTEQAKRLGVTMSSENAAAADALGDAMDNVKASLSGAANAIGIALAPMITELSAKIAENVGLVTQWIKHNQDLIIIAAKVSAGITALGFSIVAVGKAADVAAIATKGLAVSIALVGKMGIVFAALSNPIGIATVAVAGFGAAIIAASGIVPQLVDALKPLLSGVKAATEALTAGEFSKAWEIAKLSAQYFGSVVVDVFNDLPVFAGYAAGKIASAFVEGIQKAWNWILSSQEQVLSGMLKAASSFAPALLKAMFTGDFAGAAAQIAVAMKDTLAEVAKSAGEGFGIGMAGGEAPKLKSSARTTALGDALKRMLMPADKNEIEGSETPLGGSATPLGGPPTKVNRTRRVSEDPFDDGTGPSASAAILAKFFPLDKLQSLKDGGRGLLAQLASGVGGGGTQATREDSGRVSVGFSAAGLIAQGMGGRGSAKDVMTSKLQEQVSETKKAVDLLRKIEDGLGKAKLVFG